MVNVSGLFSLSEATSSILLTDGSDCAVGTKLQASQLLSRLQSGECVLPTLEGGIVSLPNIDADAMSMHSLIATAEAQMYEVPPYQRSYAWDKNEFSDFWADISELVVDDDSDVHFMGAMVFLQRKGRPWWVLDGQQRFSTLLLFLSALRDAVLAVAAERGTDGSAIAGKIQGLIAQEIPGSYPVKYEMRLTLNKRDSTLFHRILEGKEVPTKSQKDWHQSEKQLFKAYTFFLDGFTQELRKDRWEDLDEYRARIESVLLHRLCFIRVEILDEMNAQAVFEALNNRGVDLTQADLVKNYLFMEVQDDQTALREAEDIWERVVLAVSEADLAMFLRYFWNSAYTFVRMDDLYRTAKKRVSKAKGNVMTFLRQLDREGPLFAKLRAGEKSEWVDAATSANLKALKTLGLRTSYVLLLAMCGREGISDAERRAAVKAMLAFSVRYFTVGGEPANTLEKDFSDWAVQLRGGTLTNADVIEMLKKTGKTRDQFISAFKYLSVKDSATAKYMLREINLRMLRDEGRPAEFLEDLELEHIIPQTLTPEWEADIRALDDSANPEDLIYRFGNLTLLEKKFNIAGSNYVLDVKRKEAYDLSSLPTNAGLKSSASPVYPGFSTSQVLDRATQLADVAETVWIV